ncbi:putative esterase [Bacillus sp. TS-2]|nr:putative esterase [Bacillus sp. TS-2]
MSNQLEGNLTETTIQSNYLNEEQKLMIYVPPEFTPLKTYDLLICQDGQDYFQLGRIPRQIEALIKDFEIRDTIVVGVPYPSVKERRQRYHPDGDKFQAYLSFLLHELMPYLEKQYPIHPLAHGRTLAGDSLAATVSLMTAFKYPQSFGQVMLHSPYVDEKVLHTIKNTSNIDGLSIYHVIGLEETAVKTTDGQVLDFLEPNRQLKKCLENHNLDYEYHEFDGNHTWTYWQKDLENGLKKLLSFS